MQKIEIRTAEPGDALGIAIVQSYTWLTTYRGLMPEAALRQRLVETSKAAAFWEENLGSRFDCFVAEQGRSILGFANYGRTQNPAYGEDGEVYALYVLLPFQGMGLGRELFSRCAEQLERSGCRRMIVNCLFGNPALGFYRAMGGLETGQREDPVPGGQIREHILRFELPLSP